MKIVILDGYTENPGDLSWDAMAALGDLTFYDRTDVNNTQEIIDRAKVAHILITNKTPLPREVLVACDKLKYIGLMSTGYNIVDGAAARERGIPVCNVPAYGTMAVAQMTIALLLEICNRVGHHDRRIHEGAWEASEDFCFWEHPLTELDGKTIGIVGYGEIGRATGQVATALGMQVISHSRTIKPELQAQGVRYVSLDELYAQADIVSLHCPLFPETTGMINSASIAKMKDGVIILNTARGALIVEEDLKNALNCGKVSAAGLDVVSLEPMRSDNPLLKAQNCIITPHIAWASKESRQRLMDIAVQNLQCYLQGKIQNVVN